MSSRCLYVWNQTSFLKYEIQWKLIPSSPAHKKLFKIEANQEEVCNSANGVLVLQRWPLPSLPSTFKTNSPDCPWLLLWCCCLMPRFLPSVTLGWQFSPSGELKPPFSNLALTTGASGVQQPLHESTAHSGRLVTGPPLLTGRSGVFVSGHFSQEKYRMEGENDTFNGISLKSQLQSVKSELFCRFISVESGSEHWTAHSSYYVYHMPFTTLKTFITTMKLFWMMWIDGGITAMLSPFMKTFSGQHKSLTQTQNTFFSQTA